MRLAHDVEKRTGMRTQVTGSTQKRLAGKVAVVTGSSRGIGKAIARALAAEGATLAVHYCRGREQADELAAEFERNGNRVAVLQADVARPEDCHKLIETAAKQLGPVDILVNNAGVNRDRALKRLSVEEWNEVINTDLNSAFYCTSAAIPPMIERNYGRIIVMSSIIGQMGNIGQSNYAAAKAGLIAFAKSAAKELARNNITVNAMCPGSSRPTW